MITISANSKSVGDTKKIAKIFLDKILKDKNSRESALIVCLFGDLGAGKTAFTKAVAKHLGIKSTVNSPTFVIMKKYPLRLKKYKFFFHLDAYRLKNGKELLYLGWENIISNKNHLVFIEWPENVIKVLPSKVVQIFISSEKNNSRNFNIK